MIPPAALPCLRLSRYVRMAALGVALAIVSCGIPGGVRAADGAQVDEETVKAGFLFNFTKFIEWPPPASGPLLVCTASSDAFDALIARLVQGQAVGGRPLAALSLREGDSPGDCDVLFLAARRQREQSELLQGVTRGVLTVGETVQFMREGGMVRFLTENNRVRFQINQKAAEAAGLKISSKLLTLSVK